MALQYRESGQLLPINHKTVLTLAAFVVIGALLIAQTLGGRARTAGGASWRCWVIFCSLSVIRA